MSNYFFIIPINDINTFITHHLLYFSILGASIVFILLILVIVKKRKDYKVKLKEQRKSYKRLFKMLSKKNNKTY